MPTLPIGTNFGNFLTPTDSGYEGIIHSMYLKGGFQEVASIAERNLIPASDQNYAGNPSPFDGFTASGDGGWTIGRRKVGMLVSVLDTGTVSGAQGWTLENQLTVNGAVATKISGDGLTLLVADSINNLILAYKWDGSSWVSNSVMPCFISDGTYTKSHFNISGDGNTIAFISNPYAGDDTTEYGPGSETVGRIYEYQNNQYVQVAGGDIARLSNQTGMRFVDISHTGSAVTFSEFAASNDPNLSAQFPRRRFSSYLKTNGTWALRNTQGGASQLEDGYKAYLNPDGTQVLYNTTDGPTTGGLTGIAIASYDIPGMQWTQDFTLAGPWNPRDFSSSGNQFIVSGYDGSAFGMSNEDGKHRVYENTGGNWTLKGEITGYANAYSYSINSDGTRFLLQEWPNGYLINPGAVSIWDFSNGNYTQTLTAELSHDGESHSTDSDITKVVVSNGNDIKEYSLPTNNGTPVPGGLKLYSLLPVGYFGNGGNLGETEWLALSEHERAVRMDPTGTYVSEGPSFGNGFQSTYVTAADYGFQADANLCWKELELGGNDGNPVTSLGFNAGQLTVTLTHDGSGNGTPLAYSVAIPSGDNIYTSNLADSIAMTEDVGGMPSGTAVSDLTNVKTYDQLFDTILFPTSYPTASQPSTSLTDNVSNLQTIGATINMILNTTANLGNISLNGASQGQYAGNVTAANISGESGNYTLGVGPAGNAIDNQAVDGFTVQIGTNSWTLTTTFDNGPMPLDSTGADYPSLQYSSGTKTNSTSFEGVYPIKLGASTSNNDFNDRALLSHGASLNQLTCSQPYNEGAVRHRIGISGAMIAGRTVGFQQYNPVSGSYADLDASEFTSASQTFTIEGMAVNYTVYTKASPAGGGDVNGLPLYRIKFS